MEALGNPYKWKGLPSNVRHFLKKRPGIFIVIEVLSISWGGGGTTPESAPGINPKNSWIVLTVNG